MTRSRPTRAALGAIVAVLLAAATAPAAGAAVIGSSSSGFEGGPALAADGRVVIGERRHGDGAVRGDGARRILAIDPSTRAFREVAAFAPPQRVFPEIRRVLNVAGSGGIVTALLDTVLQPAAAGQGSALGSTASTSMTVLPTLTALTSCGALGAQAGLDAAAGQDFVATTGDECGPATPAVRLRTQTTTITIPGAPAPADIVGLHASGPMVAWAEVPRATAAAARPTLVLARGATGQILLRIPLGGLPAQLGVGADGTVVFSLQADASCALYVASTATPAVRRLALPSAGGLCPSPAIEPRGQTRIAVVGERVVYQALSGYGVTDLRGRAQALGDATAPATIAGGIAFDGRTVFAVRSRCSEDLLLALDSDVAAQGAPPPQGQTRAPCVIRRAGPSRLRASRDGVVRVPIRCGSTGCRATLRLVQQRSGRAERLIASAGFARSGRGTVVTRMRLPRYARELAGCDRGLLVRAVLWPFSEHSRGLGSYRIVSPARCRRGGGPPFTAVREPQP